MKNRTFDLPADSRIRRILIIKWSALGDVVISTASFQDIRKAFPQAVIDLHTLPPYAELFVHDPSFNEVFTIDVRRNQGWAGMGRCLRFLLGRSYDAVFDLQSNDRSRLLMILWRLTGRAPRWRVGNHRRFPYNVARAPGSRALHAFDVHRDTLAAAGIPTPTERPVLHPGEDHRRRCGEIMAAHGLVEGGFAVLFPGSKAGGLLKRWGAGRYAALAEMLREHGLEKVVTLGGPDDREECARIASLCGGDWLVDLCGQTRILDLVPLCAAARLIVSNDTGTAHVASCTATPMLVICGPTDPRRVKPVGANVRAIQAELGCINCYARECDHHSCMKNLTPDMVFAKLADILSGHGR
ncbi:MAG: glycosyltransferase family 9 protein [bacterium]|jgi:heptosyltransferase-2